MDYVYKLLVAIHIYGSVFWVSLSILLAFVLQPLFAKYSGIYTSEHIKAELYRGILYAFNIAFLVALFSGLGVIVINHRNVLAGKYGVFFTLKMLFLLLHFFLIRSYFTEFPAKKTSLSTAEGTNEEDTVREVAKENKTKAYFLLLNGMWLILLGVLLGHFRSW